MAGLKCSGHAFKTANSRESSSYCEGMAYRQSGTGANVPIADNPHNSGGMFDAWNAGWSKANDASGGSISKADMGCCSINPLVSS